MNVHGPVTGPQVLCARILQSLPEWFADPQANRRYADAADHLTSFVASIDEKEVGLLVFDTRLPGAAEIVLLGVLPGFHRKGVGTALVIRLEEHLREQNVQYLEVKTLAPEIESQEYEITRSFYETRGFTPLAVLHGIWDQPCLQLVKHLVDH